jgi:hypothetical protein
MEFNLTIGPQGHIYIPKLIRKTLGKNLKLLPNTTTAVIYPQNADPNDVIKSLRVIISNLELHKTKGGPQT